MLKFIRVTDVILFTSVNKISIMSGILHLYYVKIQLNLFYNCKQQLSKVICQNLIILIIFITIYRMFSAEKSPLFTPLKWFFQFVNFLTSDFLNRVMTILFVYIKQYIIFAIELWLYIIRYRDCWILTVEFHTFCKFRFWIYVKKSARQLQKHPFVLKVQPRWMM